MKKFILGTTLLLFGIMSLYYLGNGQVYANEASNKNIYKQMEIDGLHYKVVNPDPIFGSTATLISDHNNNAMLVDTQFSKEDAKKIVNIAKEKKLDIKYIYISHSDPDYYFGTNEILKSFPKAKVTATKETIHRIKDTNKDKRKVWKKTLKSNSPDKIDIPKEIKNEIIFNGHKFEIFGKDKHKTTLYNKDAGIILGGPLVATGSHLFMADTKDKESQDKWLRSLAELKSLNPKYVIPGHFGKKEKFNKEDINFTSTYIKNFQKAAAQSKNSGQLIKKMKKQYPNLPDGSLDLSAKVIMGEEKWD